MSCDMKEAHNILSRPLSLSEDELWLRNQAMQTFINEPESVLVQQEPEFVQSFYRQATKYFTEQVIRELIILGFE